MADEDVNILDTIRDLKGHEPFDAFRIVTTSGDKYLVESSDNLAIGESLLFYCFPHTDKLVYIRITQLVAIELFQERPAA